jgi:predicted DCC family thiol-disulfide oxidoreductase YuxK
VPALSNASALVVIYDGDCGICAASVVWVRRRLIGGATFLAYQDFDEDALRSLGPTREQCARRVQLVARDGSVVSGGDACLELLSGCRAPWPAIAALGRLPVIRQIVGSLYDAFARRRGAISALLHLESCRIG